MANLLSSFAPKVGDAVIVRARTVHSLSGVVVFEVQENSDVTFRLYDWDRVDPRSGKPRPLQVDRRSPASISSKARWPGDARGAGGRTLSSRAALSL